MPAEVLLSQEMFDSLYQATLAIAGAETLETVLQQIADSARELVRAEFAAISISDDSDKILTFITSGLDSGVAEKMSQLPTGIGVLGELARAKKPIRLSNIGDYPESVGFPDGHPRMKSFLGVPIKASTDVLGNLYLTNKFGEDGFSEGDQRVVEMLAAHAANAIRKASLLEEHTQYSQQLEDHNRQLEALNRATMAITGELTLSKVLQQIEKIL